MSLVAHNLNPIRVRIEDKRNVAHGACVRRDVSASQTINAARLAQARLTFFGSFLEFHDTSGIETGDLIGKGVDS